MSASFLVTIRSKPKHGLLYLAVQQYGGVKRLANFIGVSTASMNWWVNLRNYPRSAFSPFAKMRERGRRQFDPAFAKIDLTLDECWPPEVRQFIDTTRELKSLVFEQSQEVPMERLTGPVMQQLTVDVDPSVICNQQELKERMTAVLKHLTYREREIIKLRYGLGDGVTYTLEEVGHIFKVTRERIRGVEAKALRKLQQPAQADELTGFLD